MQTYVKTGKAKLKKQKILNCLKKFGMTLLALPFFLLMLWVLYEAIGMCVNRTATKRQTEALRRNLENAIFDIEIADICSKTGNTSGTGNHVECLSFIAFSTGMQKAEIESRMSKYYASDEDTWHVEEKGDGNYIIYVNTAAPFADNIEGH